jgi:hypothetical protein
LETSLLIYQAYLSPNPKKQSSVILLSYLLVRMDPVYKNPKSLQNTQDLKPLRLDFLKNRSGSTLGIGSRSSQAYSSGISTCRRKCQSSKGFELLVLFLVMLFPEKSVEQVADFVSAQGRSSSQDETSEARLKFLSASSAVSYKKIGLGEAI